MISKAHGKENVQKGKKWLTSNFSKVDSSQNSGEWNMIEVGSERNQGKEQIESPEDLR